MNWRRGIGRDGRRSDHFIESDSGYRVSKTIGRGVLYHSWGPGTDPRRAALGDFETAQEARDACERHHRTTD